LRREIEEKNNQLVDLETKRRELDERNQQLQSTIQDQQNKEVEKNEKYKNSLIELLRERAERERREDKRIVDENTIRIGTITYQKAVDVYEIWQDGETFVDLERRATKITEERDKIERLKKAVMKDRTNMKKDNQERTEKQIRDTMDYLNEMEEIYKLRLSALKKEEATLNNERDRLQIEKSIQIREIKRIRDQERSRFNNMPVLKDRYLLIKMLGRGGFSEVYKAYDLQELRIVACKIHQLNPSWKEHRKENYIKHVLRECQIHKSVHHPRLIQMFDTFIYDNNTFVTVLEYCNGYDLDLYIKKHQRIPEKEAKSIMMQVFSGLRYMNEQKQKIIHFDLKPANILFLDDGQIKITDFGLSKIMEEEDAIELTSQGAGTYWYLPPECFELGKVPKISPKVDVWSAGVVFYQMLYGKKPFGNDLSQQKILSERTIVNATTVGFPSKPIVSDEAKTFIRKCLTHDKDQRPDVWTLYNDPYLRGGKPAKGGPPPPLERQPSAGPVGSMTNMLINLNNTSTSSDGDFNL
jgi:tousled-like kinase